MRTISLILILLLSSNLYAETIRVYAQAEFVPTKAFGIVFNNQNSRNYPDAVLKELEHNLYEVSFEVIEIADDSFASAILIGPDSSKISYGTVRSLKSAAIANFADLPLCKIEIKEDYSSQIDVLKKLIAVRKEMREVSLSKLNQVLSPNLIIKIQELEKELGITNSEPISALSSPQKLNLRLFHILTAIK